MKKTMKLEFQSHSRNEQFARVAAAVFAARLDPTLEEIEDIKTAVSEAVTNAIIHGYDDNNGKVELFCGYSNSVIYIEIVDKGKGIKDISQAREPLFTSKPEMERSGMGFTIIETFMDAVRIESKIGKGTRIYMQKSLAKE